MIKLDSTTKNANIARTIRFTEDLFSQLDRIAFRNNMSFNSLILQCCKYALEHYEEDTQ